MRPLYLNIRFAAQGVSLISPSRRNPKKQSLTPHMEVDYLIYQIRSANTCVLWSSLYGASELLEVDVTEANFSHCLGRTWVSVGDERASLAHGHELVAPPRPSRILVPDSAVHRHCCGRVILTIPYDTNSHVGRSGHVMHCRLGLDP